MDNKNSFNYTYSAKEQEEIKRIRNKYTLPVEEEDKMAQLRRLDASVNSKAARLSIIIGVIGTLIMGAGMSIVMTDIGKALGEVTSVIAGICIGVAGIVLVSLAYPVYNAVLKRERKRVAPEILRISDELMK